MADSSKLSGLSNLTTKQKVVAVVTIVVIIFVIYEVVGLFSGSSESTPPPPVAKTTPAAKPMNANGPAGFGAAPPNGAPSMAATAPGAMPAAQAPVTPAPIPSQAATVPTLTSHQEVEALKQQETQQKAYLDSLNQLELLKVKRSIAETNQAIAAAQLATETANKNMSDLLTQPAVQAPQSASNFLNKSGQPEGQPPAPTNAADTAFVVISVTMQANHWNAVLGYQGKLYNVSIGDSLFDGSTVVSINRNGVVLTKDGKNRRLSIVSTL